jgi:hypothetical protein
VLCELPLPDDRELMRSTMLVRAVSGLVVLLLVACSSTPAAPAATPTRPALPSTAATTPTPSNGSPTTSVVPTASVSQPTGSAASVPADSGPPAARLAAEGGDPATGQLGTYVWRDGGSDSPWLSGSPISVGTGEPLTVTLRPAVPVESWQARIVRAAASGPDDATPIGDGSGTPRFASPSVGTWTVQVHIVFADDAGDASYFWRLDVT